MILYLSMPMSTELSASYEGPLCEYTIKDQAGNVIRNARIGDIINHEWQCKSVVTGMNVV